MCKAVTLAWGCVPMGIPPALLLAEGPWCSLGQERGNSSMVTPGAAASAGHLVIQNHRQWTQLGVYKPLSHALSPAEGFTYTFARWEICLSAGEYPAVHPRSGFLLWLQTGNESWQSGALLLSSGEQQAPGRCGCVSWGTWNQTEPL